MVLQKVIKAVSRVFGAYISRNYVENDPLRKPVKMKKYIDQSVHFVCHTMATLGGLRVIMDHPHWWYDTRTLWNGDNLLCTYDDHDFETHLFYIAQLAVIIVTSISYRYSEKMKKDHLVMMTHHVATTALIGGSYLVGYIPIGVIIVFVHDLSDIPLDLMKVLNHMGLQGPKHYF